MRERIDEKTKALLKEAGTKLTGAKKREFMAKTTLELYEGSERQAESQMGWNRRTVALGLHELRSGIKCIDNYHARGNKKTEEKIPKLKEDIISLVDPKSHADPELKTIFAYTRMTANAVRQALIEEKGYAQEQLPQEWTIGKILNRLGYRLR